MTGELILATGTSGHVGYRTLIEALSKGYKVRAAVRSESKIAEIKAAKSTQPYLEQLTFVIVPNIEKDGAFDEAVKGADYIVHIASPLAQPSGESPPFGLQSFPLPRRPLSIVPLETFRHIELKSDTDFGNQKTTTKPTSYNLLSGALSASCTLLSENHQSNE